MCVELLPKLLLVLTNKRTLPDHCLLTAVEFEFLLIIELLDGRLLTLTMFPGTLMVAFAAFMELERS